MKILLVDDDPEMLHAMLEVLRSSPDLATAVSTNGALALEHAASMNGVDLLITDVVMDPMDGFTLRSKLLESYPEMKTIFVSGYDLSDYEAYTIGCEILAKPFEGAHLLQAVAKTIPPVATPVATIAADNDPLVNKKLGDYSIIRKIGEEAWGSIYLANQTSMARPVAMEVLSEEIVKNDPAAPERFLALARAKATVKHPSILSVYEAGQEKGCVYYTYEFSDGGQLAEMQANGQTLDDKMALRILKVVVEGLAYLQKQNIPHAALEARHICVDKGGEPHLSNIAVLDGEGRAEMRGDVATLASSLAALLPGGVPGAPGLQKLFTRMSQGEAGGFATWEELLGAITELMPKVVPTDAVKITAHEQAGIRAVEKMKQEQKRSFILSVTLSVVGVCAVLFYLYWTLFRNTERDTTAMVKIPAGEFIYQNGQKAVTGEFWIDKYEVTIGQYQRFLDALKENPTTEYDSPDQPKAKTNHIPDNNAHDWTIWYGRAKAAKPARFVPIDLNCPIFNVDYWDAYAFAKWAGKRLPTEQEWEKAARGTDGRRYPWGTEFNPKKANLGKDYIPLPGPNAKGTVDGYFWWNPVDEMTGDCSPYGVIGMLGNVAEWTDTRDPQTRNPVVRGGSFHTPEAALLNRAAGVDANTCIEYLGFRCVSDKPPKTHEKN
ncbi:MAG: SUMF1/EgtB/PvdO family nonheme iron enzyme [Verrucomicrobiota bacterium]